jgi:hypothetical protein
MESPTINPCYVTNGTAYKLLNGVLMFAPLDNDNVIIEEDWGKVDFDQLSSVDLRTILLGMRFHCGIK